MSKKTFDTTDWQPTIQNTTQHVEPSHVAANDDLELIVKRIESASIDIAPNYADWRDLGFALADALDESGRNYYHRLSRFYPSYSQSETDKQYSAYLASHGHSVTIKTLYLLAKSAGVSVSIPQPQKANSGFLSPPGESTRRGIEVEAKSSIPRNGEIEEMRNQEKQLPVFPKEIFEVIARITPRNHFKR